MSFFEFNHRLESLLDKAYIYRYVGTPCTLGGREGRCAFQMEECDLPAKEKGSSRTFSYTMCKVMFYNRLEYVSK